MSTYGPAVKIQADDIAAIFRDQIQKVVEKLKAVRLYWMSKLGDLF